MNKICAILVSHNRVSRIDSIVTSLLNQTHQFENIIIIDNNSSDGTAEYLRKLDNPAIKVICLNYNAGHGASIAIGLNSTDLNEFDYYFFVEDDSSIKNDLVNQLIFKSLNYPKYDLIGSSGSIYSLGRKKRIKSSTEMIEVNFTVFSGLLIKSQVFKAIGVPVGDFFMMCDDLEFCMRAVKNGFKIGIIDLDMHEALHLGSVSSSTSTIWRSYYQSRNRILILKRQMSLYNFLDCIIWETKFLYSSLINNSPLKRIRYRLLGIFDGIIGRKGFTVDPKKF